MLKRILLAWTLAGGLTLGGNSISDEVPKPRNPVIKRVSEGYHSDKLATESIKVALIGDSLSVPFHYTPLFQASKMIHENREGGWFLGSPETDKIVSVFEKLVNDQKVPTEALNLSIAGSWIKEPEFFTSARLFGMDSMDRQVSRILDEPDFPNLILIWQGHNDADWKFAAEGRNIPRDRWPELRKNLPSEITANLSAQLRRLIDKAKKTDYPVTIVVFGLLDARSALETRKHVLQDKEKNPNLFPRLADAIKGFPSLMPEFEEETLGVFASILREWQNKVESLNQDLQRENLPKPTQILYSDALTRMKIKESLISPEDGLHLKVPEGHQEAADRVEDEIERLALLNYLHKKN